MHRTETQDPGIKARRQTTKGQDHLYLFVDEAGDFNFSQTGTRFFTFTAVSKIRPFAWDDPVANLKYDLIESGLDIEYFHASEDKQRVRDRFFDVLREHSMEPRLDSLIIEKSKTGPALHEVDVFYPRMLGYLLRYVLDQGNVGDCSGIVIITDSIPVRKKRDAVEKAIKKSVSKILPPDMKYTVLHHASRSSVGLQVADYCNWAIFRRWERSDVRSYDLIRPWMRSEFDIFRLGDRVYC